MKQIWIMRLFLFVALMVPCPAQTAAQAAPQTAAPAAQDQGTSRDNDDRFSGARKTADQLRSDYEALNKKNMAEIDSLMRTKKCQIARVDGLLDRSIASFNQYIDAELKYWDLWGNAEQTRVDNQKLTLNTMETDQKRVADFLEDTKQDREAMTRKKEELERYGKRTAEIVAQIDELVRQIKDSESRLTDAQKTYDDLTVSINNMKGSITARLVEIRQNKVGLEAYREQQKAYYEKIRDSANQICNTKQPSQGVKPVPKAGGR